MPFTKRKVCAEGACKNCGELAVSYRPTVHPLYCMKPECRAAKFREKWHKNKPAKRKTELATCSNCKETFTRRVRDGGRIEALPAFCPKPECKKEYNKMYYIWRKDGGEWGEEHRVIRTEPMVLLDKQPELQECQPCDNCAFAEICRLRVQLGLMVACEKWDTRDLEKLNNHPQYEEAMRVMQLKPNMLF